MNGDWQSDVRAEVDRYLLEYFDQKLEETRALSPRSCELVTSISDLTMRGGKRLRPIVAGAILKQLDPSAGESRIGALGASLELLQSYLLIHDDWMDQDSVRRGGPATHSCLSAKYGDEHLGASLAVLAGDLASAFASEVFGQVPFPSQHREKAYQVFWTMQREVFFGQHLDVVADEDVERVYDLKTGSYTVRGPLLLGAMLGGATADELESLKSFAQPLGIAFQLRDELLGTFGDTNVTGKPSGNDIRAGKLTFAVRFARQHLDQAGLAKLDAAFGNDEASDACVMEAAEVLVAVGAKDHAEQQLAQHSAEAKELLLGHGSFSQGSLSQLAELLTKRQH